MTLKKEIPNKITPCPIAEAVIELRFESNLPADVVIGMVFSQFKERYPNFTKLPIIEIPAVIRDNDINFKFAPHYRMVNDDFTFQIGPKCFSIVCPKEYKGWNAFYEQIIWASETIEKLGIVSKPIRLGVRYVNFFENINIFKQIELKLILPAKHLDENKNLLRTEYDDNEFHCVMGLSNAARFNDQQGSSVDIDVIYETQNIPLTIFINKIEEAHALEKKIFFELLKDDFLQKYQPEY